MADWTTIRNALGAQITAHTGLRNQPQARDQISPPVVVIIPRDTMATFGVTMDAPGMPGCFDGALQAIVLLSDAAPAEKTQRAIDVYLSSGAGQTESVAAAIMADPSLGGVVHWCIPRVVLGYGRIEYSGETYFGGRINLDIGAV